jgi:hypothetical protein
VAAENYKELKPRLKPLNDQVLKAIVQCMYHNVQDRQPQYCHNLQDRQPQYCHNVQDRQPHYCHNVQDR